MSTREIAQNIFDSLTEEQLNTFITLFKAHETPNAETINAINEIESGGGTLFTGTTDELFSEFGGNFILEEEPDEWDKEMIKCGMNDISESIPLAQAAAEMGIDLNDI